MNPEIDLYGTIGEIRDAVDALLKRGKPASVADLQALMAQVEAKSRPTITLPAKEVAALLVPELLPLLPTPATLAQAGKDAAVRMEAAIKAGTVVSVQQVTATMQQLMATMQESARQTTAAAAEYRAATAAAPRSVPVSFTDGWRWPTGLVVGSVVVTLLFSWAFGAFRGVSQADYSLVYSLAKSSTKERDAYQKQVRTFRQDMSERKSKDRRELTKLAKQYFPPIGADTVAGK
ncbi:hypothetical protein ACFST9_00380 [Hymenobacter monticola]|uniref:Uncharacterized protein n=1 Tax=Hymenobacter monticola TaxID=1705399 RepID=A0ABY4BGB5_9BACT|nr:hypothetical protein [Hymenobacter monticola]UOE36781.1 hypothetical protein MTP16_25625 [Hymenobacter monticola]